MSTILSTFPGGGFSIAFVTAGNLSSGGAVSFIPTQNCTLVSVTLALQTYTTRMQSHFNLQLLVNGPGGMPSGGGFPGFINPPANDGSFGLFTFNLKPKTAIEVAPNLLPGQVYWLSASGGASSTPVAGSGIIACSWLAGSAPSSVANASLGKSLEYRGQGGYVPSQVIPAFGINADLGPTPPGGLRAGTA